MCPNKQLVTNKQPNKSYIQLPDSDNCRRKTMTTKRAISNLIQEYKQQHIDEDDKENDNCYDDHDDDYDQDDDNDDDDDEFVDANDKLAAQCSVFCEDEQVRLQSLPVRLDETRRLLELALNNEFARAIDLCSDR